MDAHNVDIHHHIPEWDAAKAVVMPLTGGITKQNYHVDIGGETFVLRIGGKGTRLLGNDRGRENGCTAIAAQLGVGAEVIRFLSDQVVLVARFICGKNLAPEDAAQLEMLLRIAQAVYTYHNGPDFPGTFSPLETVRTYYKLALEAGVSFPNTLPQVFDLMERIEQAIGRAFEPKPCHNDLLASNFIDDGRAIRILDWEYATMGDHFFDLDE